MLSFPREALAALSPRQSSFLLVHTKAALEFEGWTMESCGCPAQEVCQQERGARDPSKEEFRNLPAATKEAAGWERHRCGWKWAV